MSVFNSSIKSYNSCTLSLSTILLHAFFIYNTLARFLYLQYSCTLSSSTILLHAFFIYNTLARFLHLQYSCTLSLSTILLHAFFIYYTLARFLHLQYSCTLSLSTILLHAFFIYYTLARFLYLLYSCTLSLSTILSPFNKHTRNFQINVLYSWDVEAFVDISHYVKLQGGQAFLGYVGSGLIFSHGLPVSSSVSTSAFNSEQLALGRDLFSTMSSGGENSAIWQFICHTI